jgi:GT2 family glycosyltransferase
MIPNLIIPVLNRYDLLDRMLASIDYPVAHLLIIDNGASQVEEDLEVHVPECVEMTTYLPMPSNLGVAGSWNLGIKLFPLDNRWTFASNDMWFEPGELEKLAWAAPTDLTLINDFPYWHAFCVGEKVVEKIGLFDEAIYPAFCEDNDYQRRAQHNEIPITLLDIKTGHDNSSTIHSDTTYRFRNNSTFPNNRSYYERKQREGDYTQGSWNLTRRRQNDWT